MTLVVTISLLSCVVLAFALLIHNRQTQLRVSAWSQLADHLDLEFTAAGSLGIYLGEISGTWKGNSVLIETIVRQPDQGVCTLITTLIVPNLPPGLHILPRQTILSDPSRIFGAKELQTGDEAFDHLFIVKGEDEHQVLTLLSSDVRAALKRYAESAGGIEIHEHAIQREILSVCTDTDLLKETLHAQAELVEALGRQQSKAMLDQEEGVFVAQTGRQ